MKRNVLLIFGGQSAEHEVSVISAQNIYQAIDKNLFNIILCGVSKSGCFYNFTGDKLMNCTAVVDNNIKDLANFLKLPEKTEFVTMESSTKIDIVFCIIHGQNGEDGAMQGFFKIYNLPIVGCDMASSVICMNKNLTRMIAEKSNIRTPKFAFFEKSESLTFDECIEKVGFPFFLKIDNLGSSIGVYKIKSRTDYNNYLQEVWQFGKKVIIDEAIEDMREIEVAILESEGKTFVSNVLGEIRHNQNKYEFYDYQSKYLDPEGAELLIPANINSDLSGKIKDIAIKIFRACGCTNMARVDFFVKDNDIYFNEINTLPGFTNISMYPALLQQSGISYTDIITKLITVEYQKEY